MPPSWKSIDALFAALTVPGLGDGSVMSAPLLFVSVYVKLLIKSPPGSVSARPILPVPVPSAPGFCPRMPVPPPLLVDSLRLEHPACHAVAAVAHVASATAKDHIFDEPLDMSGTSASRV